MHEILSVGAVVTDGAVLVTASGEIDAESAGRLNAVIEDVAPCTRVDVDLSGVTFIDSSGLRVLLMQSLALRDRGGSLEIVRTSPIVQRVAEWACVGHLFRRVQAPNIENEEPLMA